MTNHITELKIEIDKFNFDNNTDLEFIKAINDEVIFAELETSMSNELLFKFGAQFGQREVKKHIEGQI